MLFGVEDDVAAVAADEDGGEERGGDEAVGVGVVGVGDADDGDIGDGVGAGLDVADSAAGDVEVVPGAEVSGVCLLAAVGKRAEVLVEEGELVCARVEEQGDVLVAEFGDVAGDDEPVGCAESAAFGGSVRRGRCSPVRVWARESESGASWMARCR